jgi:hypothetical protein
VSIYRGLDLSNLDGVTDEERRAFASQHEDSLGHAHRGLEFLLDNRPDALKRFRLFLHLGYMSQQPSDQKVCGFALIAYYALLGYEVGCRYLIRANQGFGLSKAECMDAIALAFLCVGPRGLETMSRGLEGYQWSEPVSRDVFPDGWAFDSEAFVSGLDYSTTAMSASELRKLEEWYERTLGEVPGYVRFLGRYRPEILKVYRNRYEHTIRVLPKQVVPYTLLHYNVIRGCAAGIRENVLLAKGFGVTKSLTIQAVIAGMEYGNADAVDLVEKVAGDVFESWE